MPAFIEECRYEWKRLGVPDSLADEMAAELEADLAEAQADGVSATEMLGESDPRRFAANWARERGLVADAPPKKNRRRWLWVAAFVLALVFVAVVGLFAAWGVSTQVHVSAPQPQTVALGRGPEPRRAEGLPREANRPRVGPQGAAVPAQPLQRNRHRAAAVTRLADPAESAAVRTHHRDPAAAGLEPRSARRRRRRRWRRGPR